jgi:hypothetical protein
MKKGLPARSWRWLAAGTALVWLGLCGLFGLSVAYDVLWFSPSGRLVLSAAQGQISVIYDDGSIPGTVKGPGTWMRPTMLTPLTRPLRWWFDLYLSRTRFDLGVPLWFPVMLTVLGTTFFGHRSWRRPPGHCPKCGYDLAGIAAGVCPERGAQPLEGPHP